MTASFDFATIYGILIVPMTCAEAGYHKPGMSWSPTYVHYALQIQPSWNVVVAALSSTYACGVQPMPTWSATKWTDGTNIFASWLTREQRRFPAPTQVRIQTPIYLSKIEVNSVYKIY